MNFASLLKTVPQFKHCNMWMRTGSRVICRPPPTDTDDNYCLCVPDMGAFESWALGVGYIRTTPEEDHGYGSGDDGESPKFRCYRKGDINLIVMDDKEFYGRWWTATKAAQMFNLIDKTERIALFQGILYDRWDR